MKNEKTILHLICGLPGSGKTTLAKQLETECNAIRMNPDEWIKTIWGINEAEGNNYRDQIEQLQWNMGKKILLSGTDVIIEWGTWGKDERLKLREEAWKIGSKVKFYYLNQPKEVLKERILHRNQNRSNSELLMPEETLGEEIDRFFKVFQVPTEEELSSYDFLGIGVL